MNEQVQMPESVTERADKLLKKLIGEIRENPLYSKIAAHVSKELDDQWKTLKIQAKNTGVDNQIKEFIEKGIAEELLKTAEFDPENVDLFVSEMKEGRRISSIPVYGNSENEIVDYRYIRTPADPSDEQTDIARDINMKYLKESHRSFADSWKMKEELFNEKIKNGEMIFFGEMLFDEYIKLRADNKLDLNRIKYELVPVFDKNQITWSKDKQRVYAYTGIEKSE